MNSSNESSPNESQARRRAQALGLEDNAEQLFDKLVNNDNEGHEENDQGMLNVLRPKKTYKSKRLRPKIVEHLCDECSDTFDMELEQDDDWPGLFGTKKTKQAPRRRVLALPNVSKDAVLEAFKKAIETHELPDFEEIEKFPLTIVDSSTKEEIKQDDNQPKKSKPTRMSTRTVIRNKPKNNADKENPAPEYSRVTNEQRRRSLRPALKPKSVNQEQPQQPSGLLVQRRKRIADESSKPDDPKEQKAAEEEEEQKENNIGLFDLDVSCIPKSQYSSPVQLSPPATRVTTRRTTRQQRKASGTSSTPLVQKTQRKRYHQRVHE